VTPNVIVLSSPTPNSAPTFVPGPNIIQPAPTSGPSDFVPGQSAVEAYEAGYEASHVDLIAQLSGTEYAALRQALADLADHEAIDGGKVLPGFKLRLKAIFPSTETDSPSALRSEGDGG